MQYKIKVKSKKTSPKEGDTKRKTKYAWLPVRINNIYVWLEYYEVLYKYYEGYLYRDGHEPSKWKEVGKQLLHDINDYC